MTRQTGRLGGVPCLDRQLTEDIRDSRLRRRIPMRVMADRALISLSTLGKIERGDAGVAIGFYASVLFVLDLADRLGEIVDASRDDLGLALAEADLPQRVRWPKDTGRTLPASGDQ